MSKEFIAITSAIKNNKLVLLNTSIDSKFLSNPNGISFNDALDFLYSLMSLKKRKSGVVFVCYAFSRDNEFLFSTLSDLDKDRLFQSYDIKNKVDELEEEKENLDADYYLLKKQNKDIAQVEFERFVNYLATCELTEVLASGYKIQLTNGKKLTITKNKKSFVMYDVFGFFNTSLYDAVKRWLDLDIPVLDKKIFEATTNFSDAEQLKVFCDIETFYIKELTTKLNLELESNGIRLSRYQGCSAVSSFVLHNSNAKSEYYNYRHKRQLSNELWKASKQAYYGGRVEQFKIGTTKNVKVYDINSAYAYATTFLPVMLRKPIFSRDWKDTPFSLWFCEYDFTKENLYFGLLPNRDGRGNVTRYKMRGKGYFYQPEIAYILHHYPNCIDVKYGYYLPYQKANFTQAIIDLYNLRLKLIAENNPLEKVIKLALSSIYGKFCQHHGKSHYYNFFYAGFITSLTRMMLLDATRENQDKVICFLTDAIHTTENLNVEVSNNLGAYKVKEVAKASYIDSGIYRFYDDLGNVIKTATKGYNVFDFDKALEEIIKFRTFTAKQQFFIGHNLQSLEPLKFSKHYLSIHTQEKKEKPFASALRVFNGGAIDLTEMMIDSTPINLYGGKESGLYKESTFSERNVINFDSIIAKRF